MLRILNIRVHFSSSLWHFFGKAHLKNCKMQMRSIPICLSYCHTWLSLDHLRKRTWPRASLAVNFNIWKLSLSHYWFSGLCRVCSNAAVSQVRHSLTIHHAEIELFPYAKMPESPISHYFFPNPTAGRWYCKSRTTVGRIGLWLISRWLNDPALANLLRSGALEKIQPPLPIKLENVHACWLWNLIQHLPLFLPLYIIVLSKWIKYCHLADRTSLELEHLAVDGAGFVWGSCPLVVNLFIFTQSVLCYSFLKGVLPSMENVFITSVNKL